MATAVKTQKPEKFRSYRAGKLGAFKRSAILPSALSLL